MDANNNWGAAQGDPNIPMDAPSSDWRSQLHPDARQRIVTKIMDTLKRHLPISGPEGLGELRKIAVRFEEKIYTAATSQSDYLRKISMKMLSMETKTQGTGATNSLPSNPAVANQSSAEPASHVIQSQVRNQGQSVPISLASQPQPRQGILPQSLQNNIPSAAVQGSASLPPSLSSMTGLAQSTISNASQASNLQSMPGISQNSVNNSVGHSVPPNMYANSQRQMQARQHQQPMISQQHQQQPQNQLIYQQIQQQQQQLLKQKLQQQQQQQPLLQPPQLQASQQPLGQASSGLQSSQPTLQHTQPSMIQSAPQSGLQQNQQNSAQQSAPSLLQQHPQSILRQQQQSQQSTVHQQPSNLQQQTTTIVQQSILPPQQQQQQQQQQHLLGHQSNMPNIQQNQLLGQQNSVPDMQQQQQRLPGQQNNLLGVQQPQQMLGQQNMSLHQQQQLGSQSNISALQQQQQQQQQQSQIIGTQSSVSNMQQHQHSMHILQQNKIAAQQQQAQQTSSTLLQSQGQQSQSQSSQQQLMSQLQPHPAQLQQHPSSLPREMQQRFQASGALLQPHNAIEQQKQLLQSQKGVPEAPSTSMDSTAQTGHAGVDWQEEVYQKIKSMKESYFQELSELFQKITVKCQQHDALLPAVKQSEQSENLKKFKGHLEYMLRLLQMPKNHIQLGIKDRLPHYEKQMINFLNSQRVKKFPLPQPQGQQQFQHSVGSTQSMPQQQPSQVSQMQQHDSHVNQMQPMNSQGLVTSMQSAAVSSMQNGSMPLSTHLGIPTTQQSMMNTLQPGSNLDSAQGSALSSLPQGVGSLQQSTINSSQPTNISTLTQSSMNSLHPNVNSLQTNSSVPQHQHLKQEPQLQQQQQLMQAQQLKQHIQHRQMQQQIIQQQQQKQQMLQQQTQLQQQLHQLQKQQPAHLQAHQMPQLHQMNEVNELKARQASSLKSGLFQPHYAASQRQTYYHQQLKPGASFPISSPQNLQAPSPQISQHSSPQIDQQGLLSSLPKAGTPLQSANSPFVVPSPSTPIAPSPIPGEHEKQISGISNAGNVVNQQTSVAPTQAPSLAVSTPGISASPLLAEFANQDGHQANVVSIIPGKSSATERPLERLMKAVRSLSPKVLSSSVSDIGSVVSMIDRIAGSAPGNGSKAAVGEDLVAMTKCRLQARNFMTQDGSAVTKKMKRHTSAMPLNAMSSAGSVNDSFKQSNSLDTSESESTATSRFKRPKLEANHALLEEIRQINQKLIDTVVDIANEDVDSIAAAAEGGEGMVVKCSFCAVALSPNLKSQFASAQVSPILPLRLLVPANYPNSSPVLLDKIPVELSKEFEDLSIKAKSRFSISLRGLSQPMSLGEMARTWDICARKVIEEYAQQSGGGSFSSRYGTWENCVSA